MNINAILFKLALLMATELFSVVISYGPAMGSLL